MSETSPVRPVPPLDEAGKDHGSKRSRAMRGMLFAVGAFVALAFIVGGIAAPGLLAKFLIEREAPPESFEQLRKELGAVKDELQSLRHHMMYTADQDIIMLKVLYLNRRVPPRLARKVAVIVQENALHYRKDPDLILAIIKVESNFNPKAKSKAGATGLMQVMPQWKRQLGIVGDLNDPATSVKYGLQILGFYEQMYADEETALTAYNRGPGIVDTNLMRGDDPRNGYAAKVLEVYSALKRLSEPHEEK